jgi:hypothetical protein
MSFQQVYQHCQSLPAKLGRNELTKFVTEVVNKGPVRSVRSSLDVTRCRAYYFAANNKNHPIQALFGSNVIVLARGLNACWERFVYVKELMHHLDNEEESTDTGEEFEQMLAELTPGVGVNSPQTISEIACFWKALALFCPEGRRLELGVERATGKLDDYAIALQLRIPEAYVPYLFNGRYASMLPKLFV